MESRFRLQLTLGVLCLVVGLTQCQVTYRRSCDCEYMTEDGKCAYTLLLPTAAGSQGSNQAQCPPKVDSEPTQEVKGQLEQLKMNLTQLRLDTGDQARMLSQLQSTLMTQRESLDKVSEQIKNQPMKSATDSPDSEISMPCEVCPDVAQTLAQQQQVVQQLQQQIFQLQTAIGSIGESLSNVDDLFPMDDLNRVLEEQRNQTFILQKSLEEYARNATMSAQRMVPFACLHRGLLVSGPVRNISDSKITASSTFADPNNGHAAVRGRINTKADDTLKGAWCATEPNGPEEWLQVDLGKPKSIFGIVTKGRQDYSQWVTSYSLNYTNTDPASGTASWMEHKDVLGDVVIFVGNKDQNTAQINMLWEPIRAQFIRIIPLTSDSNKCMRADVIGCLDEQ